MGRRNRERSRQALAEAIAHHQAGRLPAAETAYRTALAADPGNIDALHLLGVIAHQTGRPALALDLIGRALALDDNFPQAHNNLALVLQSLGRLGEAEAHGRRAIALNPAYAEAHTNLGNILGDQERLDEAEACHRQALELRPDHAEALTNLGAVLERCGRLDEAEQRHRQALALRPDLIEACNNLGAVHLALSRRDAAEACFARTLAHNPRHPLALWNLGLLRLARGDLAAGWAGYDWRFEGPQRLKIRRFTIPEWQGPEWQGPEGQGKDLAGRRLLVWREQGVGDELLFASCYPDLIRHAAAQGGHVVIECDPRLVTLFARSFPHATVRAERSDAGPPDTDCHVPAGALPRWFRPTLESFAGRAGYLVPDPERLALWRDRLAALGPELRLGICWRSRDLSGARAASYAGLRQWAPLLALSGVRTVRLQYDDCTAEIADAQHHLGVTLHQWPDLDLKDDFEGVAALIANLDLVITGPTSVGELAGALGVPVWRVGIAIDWSVLGTTVRPWFAAMRLFYIQPGQTLDEALAEMARRLDALRRTAAVSDQGPEPVPEQAPIRPPADMPIPDALLEQAVGHHRAGRLDEAEPLYRRVLERVPGQPVALHLLGLLAHQRGQPAAAVPLIAQAVERAPDYVAAHINLGNALQALGRCAEAVASYDRALALKPDAADAHTNRGNALKDLNRLSEASDSHGRALAVAPDFAKAWTNLGVVLGLQDRLGDAELCHRRALDLEPDHREALTNLGTVLRVTGRLDEAAACHLRLVALDGNDARAYGDLGLVRQRQGDMAMAEACFAQALRLNPELATAHFNLGLLRLEQGDLARGWDGYNWRFAADRRAVLRNPPLPEWRGEALAGHRLLVWREQGVGDELMFATLYPDLIGHAAGQDGHGGGHVVIECDPRLVTLFARSFPQATVRAAPTRQDAPGADADLQVAAGSLPGLLRRALADFPPRPAILTADPERVALWRERLAALPPGPRIGICWRSGLLGGGRTGAYTGLRQWRPVFAVPGLNLINLQYGDTEAEIRDAERRFRQPVRRWPDLDLKNDFEGVAALMANLDLVVTAPTAVGELAGALGVPSWRMTWRQGEWTRLGTTGRPWFPTQRTILAEPGERLNDLLDRIARDLAHLSAAPDIQPQTIRPQDTGR